MHGGESHPHAENEYGLSLLFYTQDLRKGMKSVILNLIQDLDRALEFATGHFEQKAVKAPLLDRREIERLPKEYRGG